jgi:D-glycero-D-manno-heptose 1,7-bisphosphate phosphatase
MSALPNGGRGVLLDRDGTMIRDVGHLSRLDQVELLPGVPEAIQLLCERGLKVAVITNQSAVGRGFLKEEELQHIHRKLAERLAASGARVDGFYYCPHHPTDGVGAYRVACDCRKPNVGLAERAAAELKLDLGRSYVIGDQATDMELATRIGARGIFIQGRGPQTEDRRVMAGAGQRSAVVVKDLLEAAHWIVQNFMGHK